MPAMPDLPDDFFVKALHEVWAREVRRDVTASSPTRLLVFPVSRACQRVDSMRPHARPGIGKARSS